jgi:hypothetical protein
MQNQRRPLYCASGCTGFAVGTALCAEPSSTPSGSTCLQLHEGNLKSITLLLFKLQLHEGNLKSITLLLFKLQLHEGNQQHHTYLNTYNHFVCYAANHACHQICCNSQQLGACALAC